MERAPRIRCSTCGREDDTIDPCVWCYAAAAMDENIQAELDEKLFPAGSMRAYVRSTPWITDASLEREAREAAIRRGWTAV